MSSVWRKLRDSREAPNGPWRATERGFSLLEIIVVVLIIAVLAVIAIPSITLRMKDRQAQEVAHRVTTFYRNARMRAMGRGAAMLVRFDNGKVEVREAQVGTNAVTDSNCAPLPSSTCTGTTWDVADPDNHRVAGQVIAAGHYKDVTIDAYSPAGALAPALTPQLDVCFTPMGRAFFRLNQAAAFQPLTGTASVEVYRTPGGTPQGRKRKIMLLPNGSARLAL